MRDKKVDFYIDKCSFKKGYLTLHGQFTNNYFVNTTGFGFSYPFWNYRMYRDAYIFFFGVKPRLSI